MPKTQQFRDPGTPALERPAQACHHTPMGWRHLAFAAVLGLAPGTSGAQEFIAVPDIISDEAFYRLVACAAPPGGDCAKPFIRWPETRRLSLRVGIAATAESFPDYKFDLVDAAIDDAIQEINGAGAQLFLERGYAGESDIDIPLYLVDTPQGGTVSGTGVSDLDGEDLSIARVVIRSQGGSIQTAAIAISRDIRRREIASVVLEELVQALGLPTDIASPAYQRSIFSEDRNVTVWLRGQDAAALRRHYPRL